MSAKNISGKRIKLARLNREMAQIELCAALSVDHDIEMTQNTLSNIERGERIIRDVELIAFAKVLDVNPLWLLYGDKSPKFSDTPLRSK
jgi:transcriptional regulator with XRE-family HTH domain